MKVDDENFCWGTNLIWRCLAQVGQGPRIQHHTRPRQFEDRMPRKYAEYQRMIEKQARGNGTVLHNTTYTIVKQPVIQEIGLQYYSLKCWNVGVEASCEWMRTFFGAFEELDGDTATGHVGLLVQSIPSYNIWFTSEELISYTTMATRKPCRIPLLLSVINEMQT